MLKVLIVGQTPPPYMGQALMIESLLAADFRDVRLYHVRLAFSREIEEIGRFRTGKLLHVLGVILRVWAARMRHGIDVLYYPPGGPQRLPVYRDIAILLATRWLFRGTVFHFHATGVWEILPRMSRIGRRLFRLAYGRPDCAIHLSPPDPSAERSLGARRSVVIPNGMEDVAGRLGVTAPASDGVPRILFAGILRPEKGVDVLLDACRRLVARDASFRLELMGAFHASDYERKVRSTIAEHGLEARVSLLGVKSGRDKWETFAAADMFCLPSEAETFGLVVLEAMDFALPVVATRWTGSSSELVRDGETGFLVPVGDAEALADRLERLLRDPEGRARMGRRGRERFLAEFTLERWTARMESAFLAAAPGEEAA